MRSFKDRVAVITGAGSGIGRGLATELAKKGCNLALSDIDAEALKETRDLCEPYSVIVRTYTLDVADQDAMFAHADQVEREFGSVNLVFNNAGVAMASKLADTPMDDFRWLMEINFWGVVSGTQAFLPKLIASGEGHVINISSVLGLVCFPKNGAYNASKFAVRGYTETLRQELELDDVPVGVSCVHPGFVATAIARSARYGSEECAETTQQSFYRLARLKPEKAARIILKGVRKNKARILVGLDALGIEAMQRTMGSKYEGLSRVVARKTLYQ